MSLKRSAVEAVVGLRACFAQTAKVQPVTPRSIFVLRNNDIGDLVIVTPIFEALKRRFPKTRIIAGIGSWNLPVLANNPYLDQVIEINAPWHNKFVCRAPHGSLRGLIRSLFYISCSQEANKLKTLRCSIGVDILGSPEGSLLMLSAGIPWRLGMNGYAGGHSACQQIVTFDEDKNVGRTALRFAELLGATNLPESRPQLFLTEQEKDQAVETWNKLNLQGTAKRILIAPGGGFVEKCWPREHFQKLTEWLESLPNVQIMIVGSRSDFDLGEYVRHGSKQVTNLCGKTSLRETFALVWASDGVICNSSMALHTAAAFDKPTVVLLGRTFCSAEKHKSIWGYGVNDLHLGRERERNKICTVEEAIPIICSHFRW